MDIIIKDVNLIIMNAKKEKEDKLIKYLEYMYVNNAEKVTGNS